VSLPFDDVHAPMFTVGQVAGMLGVQPAFVRRLDTERVVQPARSDGNQRRYSRAEVALVQAVSQMADEGIGLAGIRRILELQAEVGRLQEALAATQPARSSVATGAERGTTRVATAPAAAPPP